MSVRESVPLPHRVPDVPTPKHNLDSKKSAVCSRSGASGDSLPTSDSKLLGGCIESVPLPHRVPDTFELNNVLDSKNPLYARVSGVSRDSLSASDSKFAIRKLA